MDNTITDNILNDLMDEDEILRELTVLYREFPAQRRAMRDAYMGLARHEAIAQLTVSVLDETNLIHPDAIEWMMRIKKAIEDKEAGVKFTAPEKDAIVKLEVATAQATYRAAKEACDTTDKQYEKLASLLMYYMSLKKFVGATERLGEDAWSGKGIK